MSFFKRDFICPYCFERNSLHNVEFRCANDPKRCPHEPDSVYSDFLGLSTQRIMPKVFKIPNPIKIMDRVKSLSIPRMLKCDHCGFPSSKRICPSCHSELPYTIGDFKDLVFSVIGAKEAGKSHFIAVLIDRIMNTVGGAFRCNLQPVDETTINRYRNDFYYPIFRKRETIITTRSARTDFSVRFPMVYTLAFIGRGILKKKKIRDVVTIAFFDTAGEDLDSEDTMSTENKYILNSSGIIVLLDPLQLPIVRSQLKKGTPLPEENTEIEDILSRTAKLIRTAKRLRQDQLIDIPVAVAFSKIDALEPLIDPSSSLKYACKHDRRFDINDFESVNTEIQSYIREWKGDYLLQQLDTNFKDYAFFGLTALGCNPHSSQKISRLRPHRVEDPFLWLLWKHGLIQASHNR